MWVTSLMDDLDLRSAPDGTKRGYRARGREAPELSPHCVQGYEAAVPAGQRARGRAVIAPLPWVVWVPRHPSRRGTLLVVHPTRPGYARVTARARTVRRVTARRQTHRPPWSAEPKHSSAFARIVQLGEVEWVGEATATAL